jgi:para-aminobenzoate synthetase/4-amino-4-deoxychorismate lyase
MSRLRIVSPDPATPGAWRVWSNPVRILAAHRPDDVPPLLRSAEAATRDDGLTALGFIAYEAGPAWDDRFILHSAAATEAPLPLAWFALFHASTPWTPAASEHQPPPALRWQAAQPAAAYRPRIAAIKQAIARGETYQVNLTFPLVAEGPTDLTPWFLHLHRRQPTPFALLIQTEAFEIASLSPERFFHRDGTRITCEPMKGTSPRAPHPHLDHAVGERLRGSVKNRAENLMIVDMVRNDLGRIARPGSVRADRLFDVAPWPTLWQMTSTITAESDAPLDQVFGALFPSASITGAPKLKTSEIIASLETGPRSVYTGAIGMLQPGGRADFAVAIRTLVSQPACRRLVYPVGSGIVWDSDPADEYRECLLKARILTAAPPRYRLLETLRWEPDSGCRWRDEHLDRIAASAAWFGFACDRVALAARLDARCAALPAAPHRIRLLLAADGRITVQVRPLDLPAHFGDPATAPALRGALDDRRTDPTSPFLYHKTTRRGIYTQARHRHPDADEVLLVNTRGELMEWTTGNLVLRCGDAWLTPDLAAGLLPGVYRDQLIAAGRISPARLTPDDLHRADAVYFINSVRGWRSVTPLSTA